jgi:hypothetical protein
MESGRDLGGRASGEKREKVGGEVERTPVETVSITTSPAHMCIPALLQ